MGIERICLQEAIHLAKRGKKYWVNVGLMYLAGLKNPLQSRVFRDPEDYVHSIMEGMNGKKGAPRIVNLYDFVMERIENNGTDNPIKDFRELIEVMLFDYTRSKERRVLTKQELEDYFARTFIPALNIALQIGESKMRGCDLPEMILIMGHLYSIRDMQVDLSRGIINIPYEELELSGLNGSFSYQDVRKNGHLSIWMDCEVKEYGRILNDCRDKLNREGDLGSRRICFPKIWAMERYCKKYFL